MNAQKANNTIGKVRQLQRKLYLAAKENSKRKFHAIYDKIHREDILKEAWKRVRTNGGTGGIDGISIEAVEVYGVGKLLDEIQQTLMQGKYHPQPVKRVYIPKADFKDNSYGFRPKRNAHQALEVVRKACNNKGWWVLDADIKGYFDAINHDKLMRLVEMRVNDRRILKLLRQWLEAGIISDGSYQASEIGSHQGGVVSPLLANIYLHYLDVMWEKHGSHLGKLVRYADDLVVICRTKKDAEHALKLVSAIMERLELTLHPEKTKLVSMWDGKEGFDFLGMHHRRIVAETGKGQKYTRTHQLPSKKATRKMREVVKAVLASRTTLVLDVKTLIERLNPKIRGWRNYYGVKTAKKWLNKIDWYILLRFTIWWNKKRQKRRHLSGIKDVRQMSSKLGLLKLAG